MPQPGPRLALAAGPHRGGAAMKPWAKLLLAGLGLAALGAAAGAAEPDKKDTRVFEMRTYYAAPGKMAALHARFRDHTCKLFEKHGMTVIGFWSPIKAEE